MIVYPPVIHILIVSAYQSGAISKAEGTALISEGVFHNFQTVGIPHQAPHLDDVLRALGLVYQKCETAQKPRAGFGTHCVFLWKWGRI